jgi:hypothetical protein
MTTNANILLPSLQINREAYRQMRGNVRRAFLRSLLTWARLCGSEGSTQPTADQLTEWLEILAIASDSDSTEMRAPVNDLKPLLAALVEKITTPITADPAPVRIVCENQMTEINKQAEKASAENRLSVHLMHRCWNRDGGGSTQMFSVTLAMDPHQMTPQEIIAAARVLDPSIPKGSRQTGIFEIQTADGFWVNPDRSEARPLKDKDARWMTNAEFDAECDGPTDPPAAPVEPKPLGFILPEDEEGAGDPTDAEIAISNRPDQDQPPVNPTEEADALAGRDFAAEQAHDEAFAKIVRLDPRQEDVAAERRQESIDQTSEWITTAPECFDGFGTFTTGHPSAGERTVRIYHDNLEWQRNRYGSGLYSCVPVVGTEIAITEKWADEVIAKADAKEAELAPSKDWFAGMSEGTLRVWYAINRACQGREAGAFFDEIPVAELGRMTIRQIAASLKDLVERGLVCEADAGSAIHRIWISPAMLAVMREGITMPLPLGDSASPEKIRQPRQPRLPKQPGEASNPGGCYLRVSAQGISHKCLNRSVAVAVLACLEQQGIDYQILTITGRFTIDQMMETARKLAQEAGSTQLQMPQPSGGYRPSKSKTANA